ncbi:hydroxymethylglutaryl-CoA reductase, degradative [Candidatus Nitrosocosmicus franklandus]|uniref:3-hydroxy-3-methylglutaryl coenzyme A reductase n=1 Tax=Candidatus Nitrosocosmicus franklandianus TaxID=1798806 RepID=A0A484ICZ0_9ARCH|nr:hydroxymethylglutaryl-CoA reductase, degradative [Candidatus Nitrosocosmicus franklandus]VFJ14079.1 3-hydroxy-3-methylglutaryl-coenzyme A reductase [Candidatus Nitrosocosmicus franklandus]
MEQKKFRDMSQDERLQYLKIKTNLSEKEIDLFRNTGGLNFNTINGMVENAIGVFPLPIGIATNFVINNKEYLIPMAIEEPSVIAAASNAAKIAGRGGGFVADVDDSIMIGQIQLIPDSNNSINKSEIDDIIKVLQDNKNKITSLANTKSKFAECIDIKIRHIEDKSINSLGIMIIVEILVDVKDAMGANVVNTMCEGIAPEIELLTGGETILKILSNYATERLVRCKAIFPRDLIGGEDVLRRILFAYAMAYTDVYRAVTHNKGIMNGIDSVAIATGQDFRAIEAGCHAYACRDGHYKSLTKWYQNSNGDLVGEIEIPMAVGTVGGITNTHPIVKSCLKLLNVSSSKELATIMAASGLAQNFSAIRALADEGIQKGHMKLHSKNIAIMAGATDNMIELVSKKMVEEKNVSVSRAKEILETLNKKGV